MSRGACPSASVVIPMSLSVSSDGAQDSKTTSGLVLEAFTPVPREDGGESLWRQIAMALRKPIEAGRWQRSAKLPTEAELAKHFDVNRHTVRRALSELLREDLLTVTQGHGTFVAGGPKLAYRLGERTRYSQIVRSEGQEPSATLMGHNVEEAGVRIGGKLDLVPDCKVLHLTLLLAANRQPNALASLWLSHERFSRFEDAFRRAETVSEALALYGVEDYTRPVTHISARLASKRECGLLKIRQPSALLQTEAISLDAQGHPVLFASAAFCAERVQMEVVHSEMNRLLG